MSPFLFTPGEPAGIGPDLAVALAHHVEPVNRGIVVVADPELLVQRASQLGLALTVRSPADLNHLQQGELAVAAVPLSVEAVAGVLDFRNSEYVLQTLDRAVEMLNSGKGSALVTGPVHKGIINEAGIHFSGHTEYLAHLSQTKRVVMMLATPLPYRPKKALRVALVTTHLPLAEVPATITRSLLTEIISIVHRSLQMQFGISHPRILVCGLNPHAGEDGHLGREEIETITPVLEECRSLGMDLTGPTPADTAFTRESIDAHDCVLAMYHDQGLATLKHLGFGHAVNITLGLPFVRTSVDHGTALNLAGTGEASSASLLYALEVARELTVSNRIAA